MIYYGVPIYKTAGTACQEQRSGNALSVKLLPVTNNIFVLFLPLWQYSYIIVYWLNFFYYSFFFIKLQTHIYIFIYTRALSSHAPQPTNILPTPPHNQVKRSKR